MTEEDLDKLIENLEDEDADVRRAGAQALGEIGSERAVEALITALNAIPEKYNYINDNGDEFYDVDALDGGYVSEMEIIIGGLGETQATEEIISALNDDLPSVRQWAARTLGEIGEPAVPALIEALGSGESTTRSGAAEALSEIGWKADGDELKALYLIAKEDWKGCVKLGNSAVTPLINALELEPLTEWVFDDGRVHSSPGSEAYFDLRVGATGALGELGDQRAVEPLGNILEADVMFGDYTTKLYEAAARALGMIGHTPAVKPLISASENFNSYEYSSVREAAVEALERIGEPAVNQLIKSLGAGNSWIAARALGKIGGASAVEPLIKVLGDSDEFVRGAATGALGEIGDVRAVLPLIQALEDDGWGVAKAAAEALGNIGDTRAVEPLIKALKDDDSNVSSASAEALGKIGDPRALDPLITALEDGNSSGAEALGEITEANIKGKEKENILRFLESDDPAMVMMGASMLKGILKE